MKGVFEISGNSRYDDLITERYHFPSQYIPQARQLENDWILYRETRVSGGRMAYIATAFVERIDPMRLIQPITMRASGTIYPSMTRCPTAIRTDASPSASFATWPVLAMPEGRSAANRCARSMAMISLPSSIRG